MTDFFTLKALNQRAREIQRQQHCKLKDALDKSVQEKLGLANYDALFRARLTLAQPVTEAKTTPPAVTEPVNAIALLSGGRYEEVAFDARPLLEQATDEELQDLVNSDFAPRLGLPYRIASAMAGNSSGMRSLLAFRDANDEMFDQVDILVELDKTAARRWVATHRPHIQLTPTEMMPPSPAGADPRVVFTLSTKEGIVSRFAVRRRADGHFEETIEQQNPDSDLPTEQLRIEVFGEESVPRRVINVLGDTWRYLEAHDLVHRFCAEMLDGVPVNRSLLFLREDE